MNLSYQRQYYGPGNNNDNKSQRNDIMFPIFSLSISICFSHSANQKGNLLCIYLLKKFRKFLLLIMEFFPHLLEKIKF